MEKAEKLGKSFFFLLITESVMIPERLQLCEIVKRGCIPDDKKGMDIGTETEDLYADAVKIAKTVVWNGPMGAFENPILQMVQIAVAKALADTDATTIIGGGDSAAAVNILGFGDKMTTSPQVAELLWNSWKEKNCQA